MFLDWEDKKMNERIKRTERTLFNIYEQLETMDPTDEAYEALLDSAAKLYAQINGDIKNETEIAVNDDRLKVEAHKIDIQSIIEQQRRENDARINSERCAAEERKTQMLALVEEKKAKKQFVMNMLTGVVDLLKIGTTIWATTYTVSHLDQRVRMATTYEEQMPILGATNKSLVQDSVREPKNNLLTLLK